MASANSSPPTRQEIRVLVADSTRMACQLLSDMLKRSHQFELVGCAPSSFEVLSCVSNDAPHVVLLSVNLDGQPLKGFKLARQLRAAYPEIKVIMLLDVSLRDLVVEAFRAGARGVFCRTDSVRTLCKCISSVYMGQVWADSKEIRFILEALAEAVPLTFIDAKGATLLSRREQEVVRSVADGLTNREIAAQLKISEHTVKNYLFRVFDKLGVSSRVEMILYALSQRATALSPKGAMVDFPQDDVATFEWYRRAAEQGLGVAQFILGLMYRDGYGVPQNPVSAYMWFQVAERTENYIAKNVREAITKLAKKMSGEQIAEAQRRAEVWLMDHQKHKEPSSSDLSDGKRSLAPDGERPTHVSNRGREKRRTPLGPQPAVA